MQNEMMVVSDGSRQLQMNDVREMLVHDLMEMDLSSKIFSSKDIAEESGRFHKNVIRDIERTLIDNLGGEAYCENIITGGKTYPQYRDKNLKELFKNVVLNIDSSFTSHPFYQGFKCFFDNRKYVEEILINGDVVTNIMLGYDSAMRCKWQLYTKSLYAQNTELVADKYLGIFDERATFNYDALTNDQKIEVGLRYLSEQAIEAGLNISPAVNPGLVPKNVPKRKITSSKKTKRIEAAKVPYVTKRNQKRNDDKIPCTDNRRHNKGSKTGRRWLKNFDFAELRIFTLNDVIENFHTTEEKLRLFLVDNKLIQRDPYLDGKTIATGYLIQGDWANRTKEVEWSSEYQKDIVVKGIEFTAHGMRYLSKLLIAKAKKFDYASNVGTNDIDEFLDADFHEYCSKYKTKM